MKYFDLMTKHLSIFLALVALCCLQYNVYAQRAENLNLNKIVQPPYNWYVHWDCIILSLRQEPVSAKAWI